MKRENGKRLIVAAIFVSLFIWSVTPLGYFFPNVALAAQVDQDLQLKAGWNAVFLEVEHEVPPVSGDRRPASVIAQRESGEWGAIRRVD